MWSLLASLLGIAGATLLFGQLVMGNRFLSSQFTRDIIRINSIHQFLGKTAVWLILLHPVAITISYQESWSFIFLPAGSSSFTNSVGLGRLAAIFLLIILIASVLFRKKLSYRLWHYIHFLAYPLIGLVLLHANAIGTSLAAIPLLQGYWYGLMVAYTLIILSRIFLWAGLGKIRYTLKQKKQLSATVIEYRFVPEGMLIKPEPGQFVYLQSRRFSEEHPFTVANFGDKSGEIVFAIKVHGPFTKTLSQLPIGAKVFIDGPYGVFTRQGQSHDPKVLIAGGIGITPFIKVIGTYGNQKTYLFYSNRDLNQAIYRSQLKKSLGSRYIDVISAKRRIDASLIKTGLPEKVWEQANFFICGPNSMNQNLAKGLRDFGIEKERIFMEKFSL